MHKIKNNNMTTLFIKYTSILLLLVFCHSVQAQTFQPHIIDVQSMEEELAMIQNKLITIHPEPFHYISGELFKEKINQLKSNLKPMTLEQWYVKLAGIISLLHDGHTVLHYNNNESKRYFKEGGKIFPFFVSVNENKQATVVGNWTNDAELDSAELIEINGRKLEHILTLMHELTFGELENYRINQVNINFSEMHYFLFGHCDSVSLVIKVKNGFVKTKQYACLNGLNLSQWNEMVKYYNLFTSQKEREHHIKLTTQNNRTVGLLTLKDFSNYKGYKDTIAEIFKSIKEKKIDTLFIDVRNNGGGEHNITEEINHYILKTPWVLVSKAQIKMSDEFYQNFPKWIRWFVKLLPKKPAIKLAALIMTKNTRIKKIVKLKDPETKASVYEIYTKPKLHYSKKYFYSGKVFLLINRRSYSMSGMFAAILQDYNRAVLVGEETGGLANPHGGITGSFTLPHSNFRMSISTSRAYRPSGKFDDHGVIPEIIVPYNQLKVANSIDELVRLIDKKNN